MENLSELAIIALWGIKEYLVALFQKTKYKKIVTKNAEHIKENTDFIREIIKLINKKNLNITNGTEYETRGEETRGDEAEFREYPKGE